MKRFFIALILLSAFVFVTACGGAAIPPPTDIPPAPPTETPKPPTAIPNTEPNAQPDAICGAGEQPAYISEIVTAKNAQGENFEPVDITDAFDPAQNTFHTIVTLQDAPKNLELGSTWYLMQAQGYKQQKIDTNTLKVPDGGSRNVDFTLKGTQPAWPVGTYCVEIYAGGKLAASKQFTVVASSAASNAGPEIITDIVLAENVKAETFEPVNPTTKFKKDAEAIHAAVKIKDAPANTMFRAKWYAPNQEPLEFNLPPVDGTRWLDFRVTPAPDGFPAGEYKVEIYVNEKLADTKTFTVQ